MIQAGEVNGVRGADLSVEQCPFGGDAGQRLRPRQPLDGQPTAHRKIAVHGVSTRRDNPFIA